MSITVCSSFHPKAYDLYGKRFLETFDRYWPRDIDLVLYTEEPVPMPRGVCRSLWDCEGARDFHNRHSKNPERCGVLAVPGWRTKDANAGYAWRYDVVKFFKQCLVPYEVSKELEQDDILVWLDADLVTFAQVPREFIPNLIVGTDIIYLGRGGFHSEIGFWAVRICKSVRNFLQRFAEMYTKDGFLEVREHHSAYIFDHVRKKAMSHTLHGRDLTPNGRGHVWLQSPLAKYTDHLKGDRRKKMGYSVDHPIKWWK